METLKLIDGDMFENLADFSWENYGNPLPTRCNQFIEFVTTFEGNVAIVFGETHRFEEFLYEIENVTNFIRKDLKFILITHNSDRCVKEIPFWPTNLVYWYSQNVDMAYDSPERKPHPIPIGLERKRWFPEQKKQKLILKKMDEINPNMKNLMYINFSPSTNPSLRNALINTYRNKDWVTIVDKPISYEEYLNDLQSHYFTLSPRGNGLDCHRTWEALYMDSIPIVSHSYNNNSLGNFNFMEENLFTITPCKLMEHRLIGVNLMGYYNNSLFEYADRIENHINKMVEKFQ